MIDIIRSIFYRLPEPPSTNYKPPYVAVDIFNGLPASPLIFDIGSKNAYADAASLARLPEGAQVKCIDLFPGPGVDIVADAHDLHMIPDGTADMVMSANTLEHVKFPQQVVAEMYRILKPGGRIYISVPFVFPYHADPDDFYRFTPQGLRLLCKDFEEIEIGFKRGPASTFHHLFVHFLGILFSFNNSKIYTGVTYISKWLFFWIKYLDYFLMRYESAMVITNESYFLGCRPADD